MRGLWSVKRWWRSLRSRLLDGITEMTRAKRRGDLLDGWLIERSKEVEDLKRQLKRLQNEKRKDTKTGSTDS